MRMSDGLTPWNCKPPHALVLDPKARIRQVTQDYSQVEFQPGIPIKMYLRVGRTMLNTIHQHIQNNEIENAYKLSTRFVTIFVEQLPHHPQYATHFNQMELAEWKERTRKVLTNAESMKKFLIEQYEKEAAKWRKLDEERLAKERAEEMQRQEEERKKLELAAAAIAKAKTLPSSVMASASASIPFSPLDVVDYDKPSATLPPTSMEVVEPKVPTIDRSLKPATSQVSFSNPSQLEVSYGQNSNAYGWRPLLIPKDLMSRFIQLAAKNTAQNIETCGILCGRLKDDVLTLSHVVIPKQSGTPDSCTTSNEEEIFAYLDTKNLITLGWIHTHPTQTAFLSSVDLHTHISYQLMLPEAVAIVCAPKFDEIGFFSLTPHHGLQFILQCQKPGFHPHPSHPPLFESSCHVELRNDLPVYFEDLRF